MKISAQNDEVGLTCGVGTQVQVGVTVLELPGDVEPKPVADVVQLALRIFQHLGLIFFTKTVELNYFKTIFCC